MEYDCEDQGFTRISDGCFNQNCLTWAPGAQRPTRPQLVQRNGFWVCPKCTGSYGAVPAADKPSKRASKDVLSPASLAALRDIAASPRARQTFNPGVSGRLTRDALVESVQLPSPFASHKGRPIEHLRITAAGQAVLSTSFA